MARTLAPHHGIQRCNERGFFIEYVPPAPCAISMVEPKLLSGLGFW